MSPPNPDSSSGDDGTRMGRYSIDRSRRSRVRKPMEEPVATERAERREGPSDEKVEEAQPVRKPGRKASGRKIETNAGDGEKPLKAKGEKRHTEDEDVDIPEAIPAPTGRSHGPRRVRKIHAPAGKNPDEPRSPDPLGTGKGISRMITAALLAVIIIIGSIGAYWNWKEKENDGEYTPDPIIVDVPGPKIGDRSVYRVEGSLHTEANGNGGEEFKINFEFLQGSLTTIEIRDFTQVEDGFGISQRALETRTDHNLKIEGEAIVPTWGRMEITKDSVVDIIDRSFSVDANTTIASRVITDMYIKYKDNILGVTSDLESNDDARLFPNLESISSQEGLESIYRYRSLEKGDSDFMDIGSIRFRWEVDKQQKIAGEQALRIAVTISDDDREEANLDNDRFYLEDIHMNTWVSNAYPMPVKNEISVSGIYNGSDSSRQVNLVYRITLMEKHFNRGDKNIEYESYASSDSNPQEERDDWFREVMPSHGSEQQSSIPDDFTAGDAYDKAYSDSSDFKDFMDQEDSPYLVLALYNESDEENDPRWNLTFAVKDSDEGYHLDVYRHRIENEGVTDLSDVQFGLSADYDQDELEQLPITFAGFEQILKNDSQVNEEIFPDNQLNFDEVTLRLQTNLVYPGIDLTKMFVQFDSSRYAYAVNKGDRFTAAVDAETGQFLFIVSHEGDEL